MSHRWLSTPQGSVCFGCKCVSDEARAQRKADEGGTTRCSLCSSWSCKRSNGIWRVAKEGPTAGQPICAACADRWYKSPGAESPWATAAAVAARSTLPDPLPSEDYVEDLGTEEEGDEGAGKRTAVSFPQADLLALL